MDDGYYLFHERQVMDDDELAELSGAHKAKFRDEDILALADGIMRAVEKNKAGLTHAGVRRGVAERIAGFLSQNLSSPNETAAPVFTVKRPTKPGYYWLKRPLCPVEVVRVFQRNGELVAEDVETVSRIAGGKWFGPIEVPQ